VQNTTLPTLSTEPWLWRPAGSSLQLTKTRDPDVQTDKLPNRQMPHMFRLWVFALGWSNGQVERKKKNLWNIFLDLAGDDGIINQW